MNPEVIAPEAPRRRIDILRFDHHGDEVHLCDSEPATDPEVHGIGFKSRKTVVWARAGGDGRWFRTGFKSRRKAMDALLNHGLRSAEERIAHLTADVPPIPTPRRRPGLPNRSNGERT